MYGGKKLPVLTLSSSRRKKKSTFEERVGRADKGFVRSFLCVYPHISIRAVFFKLILRNLRKRLESYFGDNYSSSCSKVTAILIKVSTVRGWNGEPIGSHFLRHEDDGAPATLIHGEPSFVTEIATRLAGGWLVSSNENRTLIVTVRSFSRLISEVTTVPQSGR